MKDKGDERSNLSSLLYSVVGILWIFFISYGKKKLNWFYFGYILIHQSYLIVMIRRRLIDWLILLFGFEDFCGFWTIVNDGLWNPSLFFCARFYSSWFFFNVIDLFKVRNGSFMMEKRNKRKVLLKWSKRKKKHEQNEIDRMMKVMKEDYSVCFISMMMMRYDWWWSK